MNSWAEWIWSLGGGSSRRGGCCYSHTHPGRAYLTNWQPFDGAADSHANLIGQPLLVDGVPATGTRTPINISIQWSLQGHPGLKPPLWDGDPMGILLVNSFRKPQLIWKLKTNCHAIRGSPTEEISTCHHGRREGGHEAPKSIE